MKNEEAVKTPKAAYAPPTLQKQQLIEEVLGQGVVTTHGIVGAS
jgi:hypothetical protein